MIKVTKVTLNLNAPPNRPLKGWAKIILNEVLMVSGIKVFVTKDRHTGEEVRFIRFPDRQPSLSSTGGEYVSVPIVNVVDPELRGEIEGAIFEAYDHHPKNLKKNTDEA